MLERGLFIKCYYEEEKGVGFGIVVDMDGWNLIWGSDG